MKINNVDITTILQSTVSSLLDSPYLHKGRNISAYTNLSNTPRHDPGSNPHAEP